MILISHRGNITGPDQSEENRQDYIESALNKGYDCEIDVWFVKDKWYLGHDEPQYLIERSFLLTKGLWCHAKNIDALQGLLELAITCFWHEDDNHTLTSNGFIWTYPGLPLTNKSICVMPEMRAKVYQKYDNCAGICSDYVERYR